ncbi:MAG: UDP-N-acetylmuramyl-tripeptide synthetase [bacterium]|nr:UDP-N-acetylmuramyl-tripeptide synthetase [bacterium]
MNKMRNLFSKIKNFFIYWRAVFFSQYTYSPLKSIYHFLLAFIGAWFYKWPSKKIFVVGVTGTKGKSTVLEMINAIFQSAGKKTALFSSVRRQIGDDSVLNDSGNTMPGRFALQKFLVDAVNAGCQYALIEVTSQGVVQHRHRFIEWDAAILTNLAPEHIEAHGSFENYRQAKVNFFRYVARSVKKWIHFFINKDDPNRGYFEKAANQAPVAKKKIHFFTADDFRSHLKKKADFFLAEFNLTNAAAAAALGRSQNVEWFAIEGALNNFDGVPGRVQFVQKEPFAVVVDYAHTPDSLEKIYQTVRPEKFRSGWSGELICVLGSCGGGRDKWKRPEMGRIAAQYCDKIILTNEDPYDEDPAEILRDIEKGFEQATMRRLKVNGIFKVFDRKEALTRAVNLAQKGDSVIATGKGSESWIHLSRGQKIPWNEKRNFEEVLRDIS